MVKKVDKTLVASIILHVLVIGWGLVSFSARSYEVPPSLAVDIISSDQLAKMTAGMKLPAPITADPREVGEAVAAAVHRHRDVIYVRPVWRVIMTIIRLIPETVFKRLSL